MKQLLLAVLLLTAIIGKAQLTFENAYINFTGVSVCHLEGIGYKYYTVEYDSLKLNLYNDNHSLWKSIDLKVPSGGSLSGVNYPSTMLFDLDPGIEFLVYYNIPCGAGLPPCQFIQLVDETGSILSVITDGQGADVVPFDTSWKLKVYNTNKYGHRWGEIWGLPGKFLAVKGPNTNTGNTTNDPVDMLYPNPMENSATLEYTLPNNAAKGTVTLYNNNGTQIRTYDVHQHTGKLIIQRDGLPSGSYIISTTSEGIASPPQKITMY